MTIENFVETQIVHNQHHGSQRIILITPPIFRDAMAKTQKAELYEGNIMNYKGSSKVLAIYHFKNGLDGSSIMYSYNFATNHEIILLIGLKLQIEELKALLQSQGLKLTI